MEAGTKGILYPYLPESYNDMTWEACLVEGNCSKTAIKKPDYILAFLAKAPPPSW